MQAPASAVERRGAGARPRLRAVAAALALLAAALVALPLPGTAQAAGTVEFPANDPSGATLDLRAETGKTVRFTLNEADFAEQNASRLSSMAVHLRRPATGETLVFSGTTDASGVWTASMPVDTPDLVAGDWTVSYYGVGADHLILAQRTLAVTLADDAAPRLEVKPAADPIRLGPGDAIEIEVAEEFLRAVTVQYAGLPQPLKLAAPYRLGVDALGEGVSEVTFKASDRAGQTAVSVVTVDRDTVTPLLNVSVPEVGYVGVPFAILANTTERSQMTVRLVHNGTAETRVIAGSASDAKTGHVFVATVSDLGPSSYTVEAIDVVGNRATSVFSVPIVAPPTDVRAISIGPAPGPAPFVGSPAIVVASLEQVGGVTSLPVTVTFSTAGQQETMTLTLPAVGATTVEWNVTLPPGPREVSIHVEAPSFANETNPGNENATATVETFLGSARVGDELFLIRADERGLPKAAVEESGGKSYPLTLNQSSSAGVRYEFTLPGGRTVTWDPLDPIAPEPEGTTSDSSSSSQDDDKGAPASGALLALLVVALAALVQRRK